MSKAWGQCSAARALGPERHQALLHDEAWDAGKTQALRAPENSPLHQGGREKAMTERPNIRNILAEETIQKIHSRKISQKAEQKDRWKTREGRWETPRVHARCLISGHEKLRERTERGRRPERSP